MLLAVAVLAGCAPDAPDVVDAPGLPEGIEVTLMQLRSDVADRDAQVRVVNGSDQDLDISSLQVRDDWFERPVTRTKESTVPAGRTVDLRISLPESRCDDEPDAADRRSTVTITLRAGPAYTVPLDDPLGFTDLLHEKECRAHDVAAVAGLSWSAFTPSEPGEPASLTLAIAPTGRGDVSAIELVDVQTTNLLQFDTTGAHPFALARDVTSTDAATAVDVPLVPLRCDAHAVMEDKRGTVFNVAVTVDGADGVVEIAASDALKGRILRWVADWCGFAVG